MKTILFTFTSLLLALSCAQDRMSGNGNIIKETRTVSKNFNEIESAGAFDVFIKNSPQDGKVILEGESNVLENIEVEVQVNTLVIKHKKGFNFKSHKKVNVYVNAQNLSGIGLSGSGNVVAEGIQKAENFKIGLSGSGSIKVGIDAQNTKAAISGSGDIKLSGKTNNFDVGISGSGDVEAFDLKSDNVKIGVSGSGNIEVYADKKIEAKTAGSGDILYKGNADVIDAKMSGSGKIKKM